MNKRIVTILTMLKKAQTNGELTPEKITDRLRSAKFIKLPCVDRNINKQVSFADIFSGNDL